MAATATATFSFNDFCPRCYMKTAIIIDQSAGETICSECGLLLDSSSDDQAAPESPTSLDSSSADSRAAADEDDDKAAAKKPRKGFKLLETMAENLGLGTAIKERATEIYITVDVNKTCRGRRLDAVLSACLFIACREFKLSRTLNEISAAANGVAKKDINRAIESIKKQLEFETGTCTPGELVRRFCSKLGMENEAIKAAKEAVERVEVLDIRRSPKSVLAAIIYMVIQLSNYQVPVKDIAIGTEVTELTIKKSFKDISPYAAKIIPEWYADQEKIKSIPSP